MEEDGIEANFPAEFRTRETADFFLVLLMKMLKPGGRAGLVLPDGTLFSEGVKTRIKEALLTSINSPRFRRLVSAQATRTTRSRISRERLRHRLLGRADPQQQPEGSAPLRRNAQGVALRDPAAAKPAQVLDAPWPGALSRRAAGRSGQVGRRWPRSTLPYGKRPAGAVFDAPAVDAPQHLDHLLVAHGFALGQRGEPRLEGGEAVPVLMSCLKSQSSSSTARWSMPAACPARVRSPTGCADCASKPSPAIDNALIRAWIDPPGIAARPRCCVRCHSAARCIRSARSPYEPACRRPMRAH